MARFSVIIPVYNIAPYVEECLQSMAVQTFADWEAVVVDDGSTDASAAIADSFAARDSRFRVVHRPNGGLAAARNTGLAAAGGDYVLFLDGDDTLAPAALERIQAALGGEDMLCFGARVGERLFEPAAARYASGWDYYCHRAAAGGALPFVCVVQRCYSRDFLRRGCLRFQEGILHEDNHFTPRACRAAGAVRVIPDALYCYRQREGSIMHSRTLRNRQDMLWIANDLAARFVAERDIEKRVVYRLLAQHYQAAFAGATRAEARLLRPQVDWRLYRAVSRPRPRHRLNYALLRFAPALFGWLYGCAGRRQNRKVQ